LRRRVRSGRDSSQTRCPRGVDSMPFVYSEEDIEWPEDAGDDYEPPPPLPEQFEYLAPPEFGGAAEPVRFSDSPSAKAGSTGPKPPLKVRILMWGLGKILPGAGDFMAQRKQQEQDAARRRQQLFAIVVPALRQLGGRRVRSEERRVGKERRYSGSPEREKQKR